MLETRRVLRPNGLLLVTSCLPTILKEAFWFTQINKEYNDKLCRSVLSMSEFLTILNRSKFQCVVAMNLLSTGSSTFFRNYLDYEGPLKEEWRKGTYMFEMVDSKLLAEIEKTCLNLKANGTLEQFMKKNDRTQSVGTASVFACISKDM